MKWSWTLRGRGRERSKAKMCWRLKGSSASRLTAKAMIAFARGGRGRERRRQGNERQPPSRRPPPWQATLSSHAPRGNFKRARDGASSLRLRLRLRSAFEHDARDSMVRTKGVVHRPHQRRCRGAPRFVSRLPRSKLADSGRACGLARRCFSRLRLPRQSLARSLVHAGVLQPSLVLAGVMWCRR